MPVCYIKTGVFYQLIGGIHMFDSIKELLHLKKAIQEKQDQLTSLENQIASKANELQQLDIRLSDAEIAISEKDNYVANRDVEIERIKKEAENEQQKIIDDYQQKIQDISEAYTAVKEDQSKEEQKLNASKIKLTSMKVLIKAIQHQIQGYDPVHPEQFGLTHEQYNRLDIIVPSIQLPLQSDDIQDLRKQNRELLKRLDDLLERYKTRYTTKTNQAIYQLMVIALRAELQNILTGIKYNKLDSCLGQLNEMIGKYLKIASDGNQSIAPTLNKFIAEIHVIFEALIRTEYEYYVRKEKARAEQLALKEQMRQEAEERKALEAERKKMEKEESKYKAEISNIQQQAESCTDNEKCAILLNKIAELEAQLANITEQKEQIINLQNGKAGYVYIISNLGSFGENTFKIGMTRRLDPMERIKELSSASVPFPFDVHSFIFSDDAVGLESELHHRLNSKRKNRINLRKEFFDVDIHELEKLVQEINPTAEFKTTILAAEFRQSQSM